MQLLFWGKSLFSMEEEGDFSDPGRDEFATRLTAAHGLDARAQVLAESPARLTTLRG
jgi:hypothetical protein